MTFIGRRRELDLLERAHSGTRSALIPLYGRRRVGKSELILQFLRARPGLYFLGKAAPAALQLREFLREAARALNEPLLASLATESWSEALTAVTERWTGPGKLPLVLDEFQWTVGASPELPSVLQELWDRKWSRDGRVTLILCGSYVGFMEREVLGRGSPLFGRRTAQILLPPFSYREAAEFHPGWSLVERARAYFICGGVPFYLRLFDPGRSVEKNIEEQVLDEFAPLFREPEFLLREELRDVEKYHAVLLAIAAGCTSSPAIAQKTGLPERSLHYYVQQLEQLGYVGRRHPLTGRRPAVRHVRYVLEDPLLRFWFRFVFPNLSFIQQMGPRRTLRELIRPELETYFGSCFERLCREALGHLYHREGVSASFEIGEYWDRESQIDVVGLRDDGWTDLGECKWGSVRSYPALVQELERRVSAFPNPRGATLQRRFFLKKQGKRALPDVPGASWHDLEDLYREG